MRVFIDVLAGEVVSTDEKVMLYSSGIGSCVVIAAFNRKRGKACMAHVMFPNFPRGENPDVDTRFAEDAIDKLIMTLGDPGTRNIKACLIGGGNVLKRVGDTVCKAIVNSVSKTLKDKGIKVVATDLGGSERRSVSFDTDTGDVLYRVAGGEEKVLYRL
jgi:chemotaxis protein CheD